MKEGNNIYYLLSVVKHEDAPNGVLYYCATYSNGLTTKVENYKYDSSLSFQSIPMQLN